MFSSFSSLNSSYFTACHSTKAITSLFRQSAIIWPNPWYLKYLMLLIRMGVALILWFLGFCGARVPYRLEGYLVIGLIDADELELPLLKD